MNIIVFILTVVARLVMWASFLLAALLALRVVLAWAGSNPFGWLPYNLTRITEPLVRPLRVPFSGRYTRFELVPLVAAALILMNGLFIAFVFGELAAILSDLWNNLFAGRRTMRSLLSGTVRLVGLLYVVAIFLRFFLPFLGLSYGGKLMQLIYAVTEPLLKPLRKPLRRLVGGSPFDLTALVAMFLVWMATGFVADLIWHLMM